MLFCVGVGLVTAVKLNSENAMICNSFVTHPCGEINMQFKCSKIMVRRTAFMVGFRTGGSHYRHSAHLHVINVSFNKRPTLRL
jgi:hypothetical protein